MVKYENKKRTMKVLSFVNFISQIYMQPSHSGYAASAGPVQYIAEEVEIPVPPMQFAQPQMQFAQPQMQFAQPPMQFVGQNGAAPLQFINTGHQMTSPPASLVYMA